MRWLYTLIIVFSLPFICLRLLWKSRKNVAYRHHWKERFGFINLKLEACLWCHNVSVGESVAMQSMILALHQQFPNLPILITTTTPTGRKQLQRQYTDLIQEGKLFVRYLPYDVSGFFKKLIRQTHPKLLLIMETELWPNLLHICRRQNIPTILVNARLSEKSYCGYQKIKYLSYPMLQNITQILAQSQSDAQRFIRLTYPRKKLQVVGNLKYAQTIDSSIVERGDVWRSQYFSKKRWIITAASTHKAEEQVLLDALRGLHIQYASEDILLVIVPRHYERFLEVERLIKQQKFTYQKRSTFGLKSIEVEKNVEILLGDSMGELLAYYQMADLCFVGGSLIPRGGHNILEPAKLGKPVLSGPYLFNFNALKQDMLACKALQIVQNASSLMEIISDLMEDSNLYEQASQTALAASLVYQDILEKQLKYITPYLR